MITNQVPLLMFKQGGNSCPMFQIQSFKRWRSSHLTITEFNVLCPNRDLGRTLETGEEGKGGTSGMVLDLLWGWQGREATAKPRCIMERPEEEGRMRRWDGVARSQIAPGYFFFFLHSYNRLDHV